MKPSFEPLLEEALKQSFLISENENKQSSDSLKQEIEKN